MSVEDTDTRACTIVTKLHADLAVSETKHKTLKLKLSSLMKDMKRFMDAGVSLQQMDVLKENNKKLVAELAEEQNAKIAALAKGQEYKTALDIMLATMEAQNVSDQDFGGSHGRKDSGSKQQGLLGSTLGALTRGVDSINPVSHLTRSSQPRQNKPGV